MIARILRWFGLGHRAIPLRPVAEAQDRARLQRQREAYRVRTRLERYGRVLPTSNPDCACLGAGCAFCED